MPTSAINGVRIYWEISGSAGEPMVLVHGSWGNSRNWASVLPALSRSFRVLTYDRRGHSRSERPEGHGSVREDVADLAALLEEVGFTPAHIVGSSFGAAIVLRLAVERAELFRSVIVHEPPLFGLLKHEPRAAEALRTARERVAAVVAILTAGDLEAGARQFVETVAHGPGAWSKLSQQAKNTFVNNAPTWLDEVRDPESPELDVSRLRQFSAPALLSDGDQSPPFFPLVVDQIASAMPHATRRTYVGAGHVPHLSHADEYARVVTEFCARSAPSVSRRP